MELPAWLLQEIGRLHVHALALQHALDEQTQQPTEHDES